MGTNKDIYMCCGDVVQLLSGGPAMTVAKCHQDHDGGHNTVAVDVVFFDGGAIHFNTLPVETLGIIKHKDCSDAD